MNRPLDDMLVRIASALERFSEWTGRMVAWLTLAMVIITFMVVFMRYALEFGRIWLQELGTWMHAFVFLLGAAYTLRHDEHVRVDVFYRRASARYRAWVDLLGALLLLLPTCAYIMWVSAGYVLDSWSLLESSRETGGMPGLFILKTAIPVMALFLAAQGLAQASRALLVLRGIPRDEIPHRPGEGT